MANDADVHVALHIHNHIQEGCAVCGKSLTYEDRIEALQPVSRVEGPLEVHVDLYAIHRGHRN